MNKILSKLFNREVARRANTATKMLTLMGAGATLALNHIVIHIALLAVFVIANKLEKVI